MVSVETKVFSASFLHPGSGTPNSPKQSTTDNSILLFSFFISLSPLEPEPHGCQTLPESQDK